LNTSVVKFSCALWNFTMLLYLFTREISDSFGQPVNCISMSNDGNCILAGCLDSTVRLLDRYVYNI
jgi:WD40 repeat protein